MYVAVQGAGTWTGRGLVVVRARPQGALVRERVGTTSVGTVDEDLQASNWMLADSLIARSCRGHMSLQCVLDPRATPQKECVAILLMALCGSNFLVCCVLLWPRMPQLLATTVFGLQGRF